MKKPKNPMKSNKFGSFNKRYVKGILSCNVFIMDLGHNYNRIRYRFKPEDTMF